MPHTAVEWMRFLRDCLFHFINRRLPYALHRLAGTVPAVRRLPSSGSRGQSGRVHWMPDAPFCAVANFAWFRPPCDDLPRPFDGLAALSRRAKYATNSSAATSGIPPLSQCSNAETLYFLRLSACQHPANPQFAYCARNCTVLQSEIGDKDFPSHLQGGFHHVT